MTLGEAIERLRADLYDSKPLSYDDTKAIHDALVKVEHDLGCALVCFKTDRLTECGQWIKAAHGKGSPRKPMRDAPRDREILAWSTGGKTWHQVKWVMPHRDYAWKKPTCPPDYGYWGMRWNEEYHQADGQFTCWVDLPPQLTEDEGAE